MSEQPLSGTERSRRYRYLKLNGLAAVTVSVDLRKLIAAGLLREKHASKKSIAAVVENLMNKRISTERF